MKKQNHQVSESNDNEPISILKRLTFKMRYIGIYSAIIFCFFMFQASLQSASKTVSHEVEIMNQSEVQMYPLFVSPDPKAPVVGLLNPNEEYSVLKYENIFLKNPACIAKRSGIHYFRDCYQVKQEGRLGWVIDGITVEGKRLKADFEYNAKLLFPFILSISILSVLIFILLKRLFKIKNIDIFLQNKYNLILMLTSILFLRLSLLLHVLLRAGTFVIAPGDEYGYFQVGQAIFENFNFIECHYTVGYGLYTGIFSLLLGAKSCTDVILPISYFNAIIIESITGVLIYFIALKITDSKKSSLSILLLYAVIPFIIQVNHTGGIHAYDIFSYQQCHEYSLSLYNWASWVGFTPISDTVNLCYELALILLLLYCKERREQSAFLVVIGIIFGFSGTIRPVNILLLPFVIYVLFYDRAFFISKCVGKLRYLILKFSLFSIGAIIGFLPQLIANYLQDGNIMTLPYHVYHSKLINRGFLSSNLPIDGTLIFNSASILLSMALPALFMITRKQRNIVLLMMMPFLVFYCGFFGVSSSPVRFMLLVYPSLYILTFILIANTPFAVIVSSFIIFILKPDYFVSESVELQYITYLVLISLISFFVALFLSKKSKLINRKELYILTVILLIQALIILSGFDRYHLIFLVYFAVALFSFLPCFNIMELFKKISLFKKL